MIFHRGFCKGVLSLLLLAIGIPIGLLTTPTPLAAQDYRYNPEHRRPIEATLHDLEEVAGRVVPRGDDRRRFDDAVRHLQQFSDRLHERGQFNKGKLDESIGNVQNILDHARIPERARQILSRDVTELRRLRQHFEDREYRYR